MTPPRLNADVGELPAQVFDGDEAALIPLLDDANIACGGHAGDVETMRLTVARCVAAGVVIGAHPSYPDREGFGRRRLDLDDDTLRASLLQQVLTLVDVATAAGARVAFLKPHGALYHAVDDDPAVAAVLADVVDACEPIVAARLPLVLLGAIADDTPGRRRLRDRGVQRWREAFADRGVDATGRLLPRGTPGAVLTPDDAARRARALLDDAIADTVCVHGDGPDALAIARTVREVFGPRRQRL